MPYPIKLFVHYGPPTNTHSYSIRISGQVRMRVSHLILALIPVGSNIEHWHRLGLSVALLTGCHCPDKLPFPSMKVGSLSWKPVASDLVMTLALLVWHSSSLLGLQDYSVQSSSFSFPIFRGRQKRPDLACASLSTLFHWNMPGYMTVLWPHPLSSHSLFHRLLGGKSHTGHISAMGVLTYHLHCCVACPSFAWF